LKNIDYPIKLYALKAPYLPTPDLSRLNRFDDAGLNLKTILKNRVNRIIATLLVVFAGLGIWWISQNNQAEVRIAILPIEYLSPEDGAQYISAGIHSAMIDELSKISSLIVTSRTSSNKYRNHEKSIPEIASELNVKLIIESELIEIRDSLRIKIRVIQAAPEEKQLWRKEYYRPTKEILAVYGDMALNVSEVADLEISEEEKSDLITFKQVDPDAYQAYLTGMGHLYEFSPNSLNKALQYFDLSLAKDSEYAPAYTGIAMVWGVRMQFGYVSKQEAKAEIVEAYNKALKFDKGTAVMHYNLAINNAWFFWDWEEADRQFRKTIELDAHDAKTRAYYAHYLNFMHRYEEAKIQADEALKLQPTNTTIRTLYAMHLNHSKEYAKAIQILKETLETDPNYGMALAALWTAYHNSNQYDKAAETAKIRYAAKGETEVVDILINNYIDYGYEHAMEQIAEAFILKRDSSYITPWQIATLYVRANNTEKSLDWLEKALKAEDPNMPYINCDPIFDKIRETDGFQRLLKKMGLPKD
jgi:TolB-like protein